MGIGKKNIHIICLDHFNDFLKKRKKMFRVNVDEIKIISNLGRIAIL